MNKAQTYVEQWLNFHQPYFNEEIAVPMGNYMKNRFEFIGLKADRRRALAKMFITEFGLPEVSDLYQTIRLFWDCPYREAQYFAMELPKKYKKHWDASFLALYEEMITEKSWWDSVDFIASTLVGDYFRKFPKQIAPTLPHWIASSNMWLNRSAIIFQLKYKEQTDWNLLQSSILPHIHSKEFFHQKAIGWALRQYGKFEANKVLAFVESNELKPLSKREALKYLI